MRQLVGRAAGWRLRQRAVIPLGVGCVAAGVASAGTGPGGMAVVGCVAAGLVLVAVFVTERIGRVERSES